MNRHNYLEVARYSPLGENCKCLTSAEWTGISCITSRVRSLAARSTGLGLDLDAEDFNADGPIVDIERLKGLLLGVTRRALLALIILYASRQRRFPGLSGGDTLASWSGRKMEVFSGEDIEVWLRIGVPISDVGLFSEFGRSKSFIVYARSSGEMLCKPGLGISLLETGSVLPWLSAPKHWETLKSPLRSTAAVQRQGTAKLDPNFFSTRRDMLSTGLSNKAPVISIIASSSHFFPL